MRKSIMAVLTSKSGIKKWSAIRLYGLSLQFNVNFAQITYFVVANGAALSISILIEDYDALYLCMVNMIIVSIIVTCNLVILWKQMMKFEKRKHYYYYYYHYYYYYYYCYHHHHDYYCFYYYYYYYHYSYE